MNEIKHTLIAAVLFASAALPAMGITVKLRCEHLENPIGIDTPSPRLSWQNSDSENGSAQTAYQLIVDKDSATVVNGVGRIWNSGKIVSDHILVSYKGSKLSPFTKYYWKLIQWNQNGQASQPASVASFETGMMGMANWQGEWISDGKPIDYKPAPYFRKTLPVNKKIRAARAYVAVAGLYELYVNGRKIGDRFLDPMFTRFDRRTFYTTYDITKDLLQGKNAIGLLLGNGWYNLQSKAVWAFDKAPWRSRPKFCMDVRIEYTDGSRDIISTDKSWKTHDSPLTFNSIYTGEHYDARLEMPDWCKAGFDDSKWQESARAGAPSKNIVSQQLQPIRVVEELRPVSVTKLDPTTYVYTFPKNMAGITRLKVKGPAGTTLELKHGEKLYDNGHVDIKSISEHARPEATDPDPMQTDVYTLKGAGEETFAPYFNYKGFQYVEVRTSAPLEMDEKNLTALVVHSDVDFIGEISTSNNLVNKIFKATNNSYLNNLHGYPTDCPHREKNGWTGDAHVAIETALYSYDGISIYEKWINDHLDEQQPNGELPCIIPTSGWGYHFANGTDWVSSIAIIPWQIYQFYGDKTLLERTYDGIRNYVDLLVRRSKGGLIDWALGDWVPIKAESNVEFIASLYFYKDATILSESAKLFGKEDEHKKYALLAEKIKQAINSKFLNQATGVYASGTQTEQSAALYFQVVPENIKQKVVQKLVQEVHACDDHMSVGVLGAKTLFNALSENGYADLAYQIMAQKTHPSFGYYMDKGATTLFDGWDLDKNKISSLNHIMYGECAAWLYKGIAGIFPDPAFPGFKNVILRPSFIQNLNWASGKHESLYGTVESSWKRSGKNVIYKVVIPSNSTATLFLPRKKGQAVSESGKPITKNGYISIVNEGSDIMTLRLQSGFYEFVVKND
ncbi:MAG: family 78 glycoside hydrolase catalytic domain [Bacteroidales bacterium]|nr:family 78 glycoside hydrolase catalytic domain [Bacteroidales bacterium]